jgi:HAD superfamily hydrolase (TIGR01490 family)
VVSTAPPSGIAFFDLDKTLLSKNSGSLWIRSELKQGFITPRQAAKAGLWLLGYHLGYVRIQGVIRDAISTLKDTQESVLAARTQAFYEREVRDLFRPGARRAVEHHRALGHRLVLLTTSSNYLSEPVLRDLRLDHALCNRFEVRADGTFTGEPREPLCYGEGKLVLARTYADAHDVPLSACTFYTDSMSDLPVLEAVGTPVAVHPDPRLTRHARGRGWRIEDWSR